MSDGNETPVPKDAPVMIAWNAYKASDRYSIVKKWATYPEHVDGQLWAAFYSGFFAAAVNEAPRMAEQHIAGLREAAEIVELLMTNTDFEFSDSPPLLRLKVEEKHHAILARIAELEKQI